MISKNMDTVYGTNKYFRSLSGASDVDRLQAIRGLPNDYSYQTTLGRRSQLGAYYHMNKQTLYANDHNLTNQYDFNAWGVWRDGRNTAPTMFSTKSHTEYRKHRPFFIILTTAALLVFLAVISIAGLVFYFRSIKATTEDPIIGFEGSFRIARGDLYSMGLKDNLTTVYKQKVDFYKRFIEQSLVGNDLHPSNIDVWGFGEGPLLKVSFRVFLDTRKLPQSIFSVEEYIKESLLLGTTATKSSYRPLHLDAESLKIKRIFDKDIIHSANIVKEAQTEAKSPLQLEKRLTKKDNIVPLYKQRYPTTLKPRLTSRQYSSEEEPDVDIENAPMIQGSFEGSFEVSKTDADISRKKTAPTRAYHSSSGFSSRNPFQTKAAEIEKHATVLPIHRFKSSTTSTTTTTETHSSLLLNSTSVTSSTTMSPITSSVGTTSSKPSFISPPTSERPGIKRIGETYTSSTVALSKLDLNLFTTSPTLDTQPWRPIHRGVLEILPQPAGAVPKIAENLNKSQKTVDEVDLLLNPDTPFANTSPAIDKYLSNFFNNAVRKNNFIGENSTEEDLMIYHSFGNPVFMPGVENIEQLGNGASVQPHPLPVPLLDDVVIPQFKPLKPTLGAIEKLPFNIKMDDEETKPLGSQVIIKKTVNTTDLNSTYIFKNNKNSTENSANNILSSTPPNFVNSDQISYDSAQKTAIDEDKQIISSKKVTTTTEGQPINLVSNINSMEGNASKLIEDSITTTNPTLVLQDENLKRNHSVGLSKLEGNKSATKPSSLLPTVLDDSNLFPSYSKWELVNSSSLPSNNGVPGNIRKVFNKTLQAWLSEDAKKTENLKPSDVKTLISNATNVEDISHIFDTLASKLGILPIVPTKIPPFSQIKTKHVDESDYNQKKPVSTTTTVEPIIFSSSDSSTTKSFIELELQQQKPLTSSIYNDTSTLNASPQRFDEPILGEAEVEVVNPNKYDEILKYSQSAESTTLKTSLDKLVTLLPVRSNSGIRTYRPLPVNGE